MIQAVKGFSVVTEAKLFFWNSLALISASSAFSKSNLYLWKFSVHIFLKPSLKDFEHYFSGMWNECNCAIFWTVFGIANTLSQQHKRLLYTWTSPDGQYRNQIDYILSSQKWRSSIKLAKTTPGADCGSDHEFLIAKFRLKLNKVGKTTQLIQVWPKPNPYDYTVKVTNRFKG